MGQYKMKRTDKKMDDLLDKVESGNAGGSGGGAAMINATYDELVALRNNGQLIPGQMYRMIDYETIVSGSDIKSAMHPFDLILTALDEKTLSEECRAIQSARDTKGYFANCNLAAWKVSYCLDNNTQRFSWAAEKSIKISVDGGSLTAVKTTLSNIFLIDENHNQLGEVQPYILMNMGGAEGLAYYMCIDENVVVGENIQYLMLYNSNNYQFDMEGFVLQPNSGVMMAADVFEVTSVYKSDIRGKGVIYRLFDQEMNIDIYYDFKNIMFKGQTTTGDYYFYTIGTKEEVDYSWLMGNIKITMDNIVGASGEVLLLNTVPLGYYRLDPRYFDGGSMGNITIRNCQKIHLYTMEGRMENLYFENCNIDCQNIGTGVYFRYVNNSSFKNITGSLQFSSSANKYGNIDADGALPPSGLYNGEIKTYVRKLSNGATLIYNDDDIYNAINK